MDIIGNRSKKNFYIWITDYSDIDDTADISKLKKAIMKYLSDGYIFR